jgi:hypothetical protein
MFFYFASLIITRCLRIRIKLLAYLVDENTIKTVHLKQIHEKMSRSKNCDNVLTNVLLQKYLNDAIDIFDISKYTKHDEFMYAQECNTIRNVLNYPVQLCFLDL